MQLLYRAGLVAALCGIAILTSFGIVSLFTTHAYGDVGELRATAPPTAEWRAAQATSALAPPPSSTPLPAAAQTTSAPTQVASPTSAPSIAALETTAPTSAAPAAGIRERVAAAEAAVRMGRITATIADRAGIRSSALVLFDLGDSQRAPRLQITTTYTGTAGAQVAERIMIGDRLWEHAPGGSRTTGAARQSVWDSIQPFLPHADAAAQPGIADEGGSLVLWWYDAGSDADTTLLVDPATGTPQRLRQATRTTGAVITMYYELNAPVEIATPDTN